LGGGTGADDVFAVGEVDTFRRAQEQRVQLTVLSDFHVNAPSVMLGQEAALVGGGADTSAETQEKRRQSQGGAKVRDRRSSARRGRGPG
jgi:hypothetical protein